MSKDSAVALAPWASLITNDRVTRFIGREDPVDLTEAHLGRIAEWLAVAWVNVTGEEYEHREVGVPVDTKEYTEILAKEGTLYAGEWIIPKAAISEAAFNDHFDRLERDCE